MQNKFPPPERLSSRISALSSYTGFTRPSRKSLLLILVISVSFLVGCYQNYPAWINSYIQTDDARANIFWLHHLIDPALFADDYLTRYAIFYEATGSYYLYYWASAVMDPFLLEKALPIILLMVCAAFLFLTGYRLTGPFGGLTFVLLFVLFPNHNDYFNAGYSRIFAFPSAIIFIYLLLTERLKHLIWFLPLTALFYPIVFLLNATCYLLWIILKGFQSARQHSGNEWGHCYSKQCSPKQCYSKHSYSKHSYSNQSQQKRIVYFLLAMSLCAMVLLPKYAVPNPEFGELLSYQQIIDDPGGYQNGRNPILPPQPITEKIIPELGHPFVVLSLVFILLSLGINLFQQVPNVFWLYMVSGLLLYDLSYLLLLTLYFPYKYFVYSFSLALFLILSFGLGRFFDGLKKASHRLLSFFILILIAAIFYGHQLIPARDMDDFSENAFLYQYLQSLPKNSLLAAPPYLADNIPLFAARPVLFNHELASPWFSQHSQTMRERIDDFYAAYYADNSQDIARFMQKYRVDYLLVDQNDFQNLERERFYMEPFNASIKHWVKTNRGHYYLMKAAESLSQFQWQNYRLISRKRLEEQR